MPLSKDATKASDVPTPGAPKPDQPNSPSTETATKPNATGDAAGTADTDARPDVAPGFHVQRGTNLIAGPYDTAADAQAFIDGHLDGKGKVKEVPATPEHPATNA